jgi:hypothetical protein
MTKRVLFLAAAALSLAAPAFAAQTNTYQVTGPVVEVTDDSITVTKGSEKFEIAKTADTNVKGDAPKVGDKVTVVYRMSAASIEVKPAAAAKPAKSPKAPK